MAKKIGIRSARKAALNMAAAMVRDADFESLFGDFALDAYEQEDGEDILARAQKEVADRIQRLAGDSP